MKAVFFLGLAMMAGSSAVTYDFNRQLVNNPEAVQDLASYAAGLQMRAVNLMQSDTPKDPRQAKLPQVRRGMATGSASFSAAPQSTQAQIDDFVSDSPQLQAMVKADRAAAKENWWARIRHKVTGTTDQKDTKRLADIRSRNFPVRKQGIDPSALAGMNPVQLYGNRAAISQGLATTAANNMNDVVQSMKDAGVDMSAYDNHVFD